MKQDVGACCCYCYSCFKLFLNKIKLFYLNGYT